MSEFVGMLRLNFIVSFLVCMSILEHAFCSEISDIDQLNSSIPVASSSKLFGNDDEDYVEDDLENIFMTQKAVRAFLALQDIECSDHENCEQELFVDEDYFLIGKGCDIEYVVAPEVRQLSFDTISEKIGLAYFDGEKEIE